MVAKQQHRTNDPDKNGSRFLSLDQKKRILFFMPFKTNKKPATHRKSIILKQKLFLFFFFTIYLLFTCLKYYVKQFLAPVKFIQLFCVY